jgi:hypothetical protein
MNHETLHSWSLSFLVPEEPLAENSS